MKRIVARPIDPACYRALPATLPPLLRRLYAARGVDDAQALTHQLDQLPPFNTLGQIERAVELLHAALIEELPIVIVGDFDADGATSSALAVRVLRRYGAHHVRYLVPNRFEYGYGLTPPIAELAAANGPALLITVDNGTSSIAGVAAARARGLRVLITDHHLPGLQLPEADALVNPNLPGDAFPSKHLAGVGVIFYVLLALRAHLDAAGWFQARGIERPVLADVLDLVALGTVADVVPLDHTNRILVAQGIRRLRAGKAQPGLLALLERAGRTPARVTAQDLAFAVAPRLNAAGRLADMSLGIACLLDDDMDTAHAHAGELDTLNQERRRIEAEMQDQALTALADLELPGAESLPAGLCLYDARWHQGVIGLVAGRVKDRLHRPVIALADGGDGVLKGSARSLPGLHMRDALEHIASCHPGLITQFGGHAMAAGMVIPCANFAALRAAFAAEAQRWLSVEDLQGVIITDGVLAADELSIANAELLRASGPWGQGFPEPQFHGTFEIVNSRVVGARHRRLTLRTPENKAQLSAMWFNAESTALAPGQQVQVVYRLDADPYWSPPALSLRVEALGKR